MKHIELLRDMVGILDLVLWEYYRYRLGFMHTDDDHRGGKRVPVRLYVMRAAAVVQRSGVVA